MSCSQNALKDDESVISCICLEPGSYLIYSPYKIMAKTSDNTLLEYKEVDNFVIIKNYNKMENIGKDEIVTTYKPSTQIETINNHKVKVVKQFNVDKTYHYKYYSCRENN